MLVGLGESRRIVTFETSAILTDIECLKKAIRSVFPEVLGPGQDFFLQIKNEEWGGVFIDLLDGEVLNKSTMRAILKPAVPAVQVCFHLASRFYKSKLINRLHHHLQVTAQ